MTLVGEKPLGEDAHRYYDDLVKKLQQDKHVEHALNFWGQRFTSSGIESYDHETTQIATWFPRPKRR